MSLDALIKTRIRTHGPISIADYMSLALAHPQHGYYMRKDPLGAAGDFITAPEISQVFGELIGLWLAEQWRILGKPASALAELGPGRGTLMNDILRATRHVQGFHDAIAIHLVETSPALKQKQWQTLAKKHPRISWHDSIDALPETPLLLVANEFFDALPIRQFVGDEERMVGLEKDKLCFVIASKVKQSSLDCHVANAPRNDIKETCEPAQDITRSIARHIATHTGAALIIDYGYEQGEGDTLQAVRDHKYCDILSHPGETDLTAHVDFSALKNVAQHVSVYGSQPQGAFLGKLGAVERAVRLCEGAPDAQQAAIMSSVARLVSPDQMGELFKVMCIVPPAHPKPEGF